LNDSDKICFICGNKSPVSFEPLYSKCITCGHEVTNSQEQQSYIINNKLSKEAVKRKGLTDKFKQRVLKECAVTNEFLLDVGSANGKFLYHNKSLFKGCMGIEITDECFEFTKKQLGLNIVKNIASVDNKVSVVTFWHSLEHMPVGEIQKMFDVIRLKASTDTRVIICVPNNNSFQYMLFGTDFAYYDSSSHIHQFSGRSLDMLMSNYGFIKQRIFYSISYSAFGYLQGLLNKCNTIHNYFYYRKNRGWTFQRNKLDLLFYDVFNLFLIIVFIIPALLLSIVDFLSLEKAGVVTACYRRKKP